MSVSSSRLTSQSLDQPEAAAGLAKAILYAEVALTIFCLLMFSNALIGPLFAPQTLDAAAAESDSAILRVMWLPVYAVTLLLIGFRVTRLMRILPALFMTGLLVGLCFASSYWSIAPDITTRRTIAVAVTSLFGLYLAARYKGEDLVQIIAFSFAILAFGSYFVCLFVPHLGIHDDINAGAWKGLWYEKNQMAAMMVLGFIASCASAYIAPERRKAWIGLAAMIFLLVVLLQDLAARLSGQRRGLPRTDRPAARWRAQHRLYLAGGDGGPDRQRPVLYRSRHDLQNARQGPYAYRPH